MVLKMQYLDEMCKNKISGVKVAALQDKILSIYVLLQCLIIFIAILIHLKMN